MSADVTEEGPAEYSRAQYRTDRDSRVQQNTREQSRAGRRCQQRRSLAVYLASHSHGPRSAGQEAVRSAFLMSELFIVVGSSVEQDMKTRVKGFDENFCLTLDQARVFP